MIPWEHDFDIAIAEDQKEIAFALLEKLGFTVSTASFFLSDYLESKQRKISDYYFGAAFVI